MNKEQIFFLQILSDFVHNTETEKQYGLDWSKIMTYAEKHELSGIVYRQCKKQLPEYERLKLEKSCAAECFLYVNQKSQYKAVAAQLSGKNIRFIPVKGLQIAQYYPEPACRTMGDIDLVIDKEQLFAIDTVFKQNGFVLEKSTEHEWDYRKKSFYYELHGSLYESDDPHRRKAVEFYSDLWDHTYRSPEGEHLLDWNYHFVYLLQHIRQHLLWEGIGFRQFLDLAVLISQIEFDWHYISYSCQTIGLYDFLCTCLAFVNRWYNISVPVRRDFSEAFYEQVTEKVFADGVFGFDNDINKIYAVRSEAEKSAHSLLFVKMKLACRMMFPSYSQMAANEKFKFIKGRPFLLPVAWVYRAWYAIKHRDVRNMKKLKVTVTANSKMVADYTSMLKQWGL